MRDSHETTFLRSIAENDTDVGRFVLADWLEERGETARSNFLRVQCELAAPNLAEKRRHELRVQERALLDAHRHEWIQAFGLPMEEVHFERGLIAAMRLSQWDGGKLLDAAYAPWLVTLKELDLSGLEIGDDGLMAFARSAIFPALRKLILSNNRITNVGARALAAAPGLPGLETVYLFQNKVSEDARTALSEAAHFTLANLDLGERDEGYCMSPGEAEMGRRQYVRAHLLPVVREHFQTYPLLQSAMLCVAQYWADEANDAVHGELIVSELFEPTLEGAHSGDGSKDEWSDVNVPHTHIKKEYGDGGSAIDLYGAHWDDNHGAIPLWAAYAPEEGHQEYEQLSEVYAPAMMFYRHGGYEFLPMQRPHLDGIRPEWGSDE